MLGYPSRRVAAIMNEQECRLIVRARSGLGEPDWARCERCGASSPLTCHHRRNRSQGGLWAPSNIIVLCGSGTQKCHGHVTANPAEARSEGWSLQAGDDPLLVPIMHHALGMLVLLDDEGMLIPYGEG